MPDGRMPDARMSDVGMPHAEKPVLEPEDAKLVTLARMARTRAYAPHTGVADGAAVRDTDGRTYAAATVENADPALTMSALRGAMSAAVSSGISTFEAAVLLSDAAEPEQASVRPGDEPVLREFGVPVVHFAAADGRLLRTWTL